MTSPQANRAARRWLAPEVVQTSGMDCGPAALKSLLEGFGLPVSYGRLREACHTGVDGTSIDAIEELACALGLHAEQVLIPADHVLLDDTVSFPAIAVTKRPSGGAHFVVLWRSLGPFVQVMDPARGRLWMSRASLLGQLHRHTAIVPGESWRAWAGTDGFLRPLTLRVRSLGLSASEAGAAIGQATGDPTWRGLATLDASVRMTSALVAAGAITRHQVRTTLAAVQADGALHIPDSYWSVRLDASHADGDQLRYRGAVVVRTPHGRQPLRPAVTSPELSAAVAEAPARPIREVLRVLRTAGAIGPSLVVLAVLMAAFGVVVEAVLLRSVLNVSARLSLPTQSVLAGAALAAFAALLLGVELLLATAERKASGQLETRFRIAFLDKMPRLADGYFQSRPMSDMLERSHGAHLLRALPPLGIRVARVTAELLITTVAIAWLDPRAAGLAVVACVAAAAIPLAGAYALSERDLKVRTYAGALTRFHLDALLGRTTIAAHGAESAVEREHDRLLGDWVTAYGALRRGSVLIEALQMLVGFSLAGWILFGHVSGGAGGTLLLLAYWVLNVPALGYELALAAREYPVYRSAILRLLEPLGAPDATAIGTSATSADALPSHDAGARLALRDADVRIAGHAVLEGLNVSLDPGTHLAIVGPSGAGKSTMAGLLLGWQTPAAGSVLVDGLPLVGEHLDRVRQFTAWVDPTVQIWNASLLENLRYGAEHTGTAVASVIEAAGLLPVVARLPEGLATRLGENGSVLSAGEAQRIRLARAMMRPDIRLVVLDEPFLGLERDRRRALLAHLRQRWAGQTLVYVTHDVSETRLFDRVIVLDRGRAVEDDDPRVLAQMPTSRYRRMLQAQDAVHARLTTGVEWRRVRLESGRIVQEHASAPLEQRA